MGHWLKKMTEILQAILNYEQANYTVLTEIRDLLKERQN